MAGINGTSGVRIYKLSIGTYGLKQSFKLRMHKVFAQNRYRLLYLPIQNRIVNSGANTGSYIDKNHNNRMSLHLYTFTIFGLQDSRSRKEVTDIIEQFQSFYSITMIS